MPNAIITKSVLTSGFNQAQLTAAIVSAANNCGFTSGTFISQGTVSTNTRTAYSHQFNAQTKGTVFCEFVVNSTATTVTFNLSDNYNTTTFSATGPATNTITGLTNTASYDIYAVNHNEIKGLVIHRQASSSHDFIGFVRPATIPGWWNQNNFLYCSTLTDSVIYNLPFPSPYSTSTTTTTFILSGPTNSAAALGGSNGENTSDLLLAPLFFVEDRGYFGQLSTDICLGRRNNTSGVTLNPGDRYIVSAGIQEYQILYNTNYWCLAIRVV